MGVQGPGQELLVVAMEGEELVAFQVWYRGAE